jgi:ABC-2 type transport system permease protein
MTRSTSRVAAIVSKDLAELRHNLGAIVPVVLLALVALALPFFIVFALPVITGEPLSADADFALALSRAAPVLPRAATLGDEAIVQAFVLHQFMLLLLLVPVTGAITFAAHSLIGEKQARTLEPLLATPITTIELLVAKGLGALLPSLAITLAAYVAYIAGLVALAEPGVLRALVTPQTMLLMFGLGPVASLVALQIGVIVSSRVNDPRTAQQIGGFFILPLTALFVAQMSGFVTLTMTLTVVLFLALLAAWVLLVLFGVALFEREAILTRWK